MLCPADLHRCDLADCRAGCELCAERPLRECSECGVVVVTVTYDICNDCFEQHRVPNALPVSVMQAWWS